MGETKLPITNPSMKLGECVDIDDLYEYRLKVICCGVQTDGTITPIKVNSAGELVLAGT
jgi:hypothetical protein